MNPSAPSLVTQYRMHVVTNRFDAERAAGVGNAKKRRSDAMARIYIPSVTGMRELPGD